MKNYLSLSLLILILFIGSSALSPTRVGAFYAVQEEEQNMTDEELSQHIENKALVDLEEKKAVGQQRYDQRMEKKRETVRAMASIAIQQQQLIELKQQRLHNQQEESNGTTNAIILILSAAVVAGIGSWWWYHNHYTPNSVTT